MIVPVLTAGASAVEQALNAVASPYPPSFDNNPLVFGWALFARLLVFLLAASTILKIRERNIVERIPANHPVYYHRMVTASFLWAGLLGSLSDVLTYLFWGEVSGAITSTIMLISRMLDALTMIPFMMALFVPFWLNWLCRIGVLPVAPSVLLNGLVNDARAAWTSPSLPIRLTVYSAIASAMITVGKYWVWLEHGHR